MTTNDEIDAMRMMSKQPLQSYKIYHDSEPWGSHRMHYDPTSLAEWISSPNARDYAYFNRMRMMRDVPEHNIYAPGPWDHSFYNRFNGGKKRKNTIKRRKSRKVGKSRRGGGRQGTNSWGMPHLTS